MTRSRSRLSPVVEKLLREEDAYLAAVAPVQRSRQEAETLDGIVTDSEADPDDTSPAKADRKPNKRKSRK